MLLNQWAGISATSCKAPTEDGRQDGSANCHDQEEVHRGQQERKIALSAKDLE
jgi:hypothetical protein